MTSMKRTSIEKKPCYLFWWAITFLVFGCFIVFMGIFKDVTLSIIIGLACIAINAFVLTQIDDIKSIITYVGKDYTCVEIKIDKYYMVIIDNLIHKKYIIATFFSEGAIAKIKNNEDITLTLKCKIGNDMKIPDLATITIGQEECNAIVGAVYDPFTEKKG